jgi:hypothetical protein
VIASDVQGAWKRGRFVGLSRSHFALRAGATAMAVLVLAMTGTAAQQAAGQESPASQPQTTVVAPALTAESVQAKIDELTASTEVDAAQREQALELYRTALSRLVSARVIKELAATMRQTIESAPKATAALRQELEQLKLPVEAATQPASQEEAQSSLNVTQVELSEARSRLTTIEESLGAIALRPDAARKELAAEKQNLQELEQARATAAAASEPAIVAEARRVSLVARTLARTRQADALEREILSLPARQDQLGAEQDLAAARVAKLDKRVADLQTHINLRREQDARRQQEEAERIRAELADRHPVLAEYAQTNAALGQALLDLTEQVNRSTRVRADTKEALLSSMRGAWRKSHTHCYWRER